MLASAPSLLVQFVGPWNEQMAKQVSFNIADEISMPNDFVNDEELSDNEFCGYIPCEDGNL